jgi:hypothetical protein
MRLNFTARRMAGIANRRSSPSVGILLYMATLHTKEGRPLRQSGHDLFSRSGTHVARLRGKKAYSPDGKYVGTIIGNRLVYRSTDCATVGSVLRVAPALGPHRHGPPVPPSPAKSPRFPTRAGARSVADARQRAGGYNADTGGIPRTQRWLALWSLARLARWRARREEGRNWPKTLALGPWRGATAHMRDRTYYALAVVWIGLIFVPFPSDWNPFAKKEEAETFLRTLWQVDAAALALSLAIIVFAVQAFRSANQERYGALRRFISASRLREGYEQGVVALLITGVVLLGAGHGGVAGWAGMVAVLACFGSIFILPPLLSSALNTTHKGFLREERKDRLTGAVSEQVDREVEALHGAALLRELAAKEPVKLDPYVVGGRDPAMNAVLAGTAGSVVDINLRRLAGLARRTRDAGGVTLATRLYGFVGADTQLLLLPAAADDGDTRAAVSVVKVKQGRWRDEMLRRYLKDLEEEAIGTIRGGAPGTFESIGDAYVDTLMEFPRSWERYGHEYSVAGARGNELFPVGPVDTIRQQFYTNIVEALRGPSDEVLSRAAYLPINVCTSALTFRADGLLSQMIGLSTSFVAAGWAHGGDKGKTLARQMPRHLVEFTRYRLQQNLEQGEIADRLRFGGYVRLVYDQFGTILKLGVDRGEADYVRTVDGDWDTLLEHVNVDPYSSHPTVLRRLEEEAERDEPGAAERLEEAKESAQFTELIQGLSDRRTILRFGLALWTWRQQPKAWRESFTRFTAQLGGLPGLTNATTKAIVAEFEDRAGAPWSDWILATLQEGRVHTVDTATAAVETFIAAALRAVRPDESAPELPAAEWMVTYLDHARDVLGKAVTDARDEDLPDVAERATRVREALEAGAEAWRQQERQSMIETPLAPEKVSAFREQTRASLAKSRIVPDLLRLAGAITQLDTPPADPVAATQGLLHSRRPVRRAGYDRARHRHGRSSLGAAHLDPADDDCGAASARRRRRGPRERSRVRGPAAPDRSERSAGADGDRSGRARAASVGARGSDGPRVPRERHRAAGGVERFGGHRAQLLRRL